MSRILLIAAVIGVVFLGANWLQQWLKKPAARPAKTMLIKAGLSLLVLIVVVLVLTGRLHWIAAVFAAILPLLRQLAPLLIRFFPLLSKLYRDNQASRPQPGNQSKVNTEILEMTLDHDSGELAGKIKSGPYSGQSLDELSLQQVLEVFAYCRTRDTESTELLATYLDRRFGDEWRADVESQQSEYSTESRSHNGEMTSQEALAVLGLPKEANKEDIIQAHRKLMQKLHPDRGGSDYLAAKVNQAKAVLLK